MSKKKHGALKELIGCSFLSNQSFGISRGIEIKKETTFGTNLVTNKDNLL